jgi:hypothetical protein
VFCRRHLFHIALAANVAFLLGAVPCFANEASISCGSTTHEAIAAAEKAFTAKDPGSQANALGCVIRALKQLDADQAIVRIGEDNHPVFRGPQAPKGSPKPQ